jgi:hypothetical protein
LNHDDDIWAYWLYKDGELIDRYDSNPAYFDGTDPGFFAFLFGSIWLQKPKSLKAAAPDGGRAPLLCEVFGVEEKTAEVEAILREESGSGGFLFEVERHENLARLLNLPECSVGLGFNYLSMGDEPPGLELAKMEFTGQ